MKPVLSICMMVKNEEKNMERCLRSLQPLMQAIPTELIIVDTGSSDRTTEIANQFTDKVMFHLWNNNFSEMRNITISYATGQWVLIIDADEEIETADALMSFLKAHPHNHIGCATMLVKNITNGLSGQYSTSLSPRLFRHNNNFLYRGAVHNEPFFRGRIVHLDSSLIHYGYMASDKELMESKFQRTSTLLQAELEKDPDNIYYRYQLSISYSMHGQWSEALQELQKVYRRYKNENDSFWQKHLYVLGGFLQACLANGFSNDEIIQFGLRGIKLEPEYIDLYFFLAQLYEILDNFTDAYEYYVKHVEFIKNFSKSAISHNMSLQFYTISLLSTDYFRMGVISFREKSYVKARCFLQQMLTITAEDDIYISQARNLLIELDFIDKNFIDSFTIHKTLIEKKLNQKLADIESETEKLWIKMDEKDRRSFCIQFKDLPNLYGTLNRLRLYNGNIDETGWQSLISAVKSMNMNLLPDYYAPILAYCMKYCPQQACQLSACLSERTIVEYMKYLDEADKAMFVAICREFINFADRSVNQYQLVRLQKNAAKYLLFSGDLNDVEYPQIFDDYIEKGIYFLNSLYNDKLFENNIIYDLKNAEENFLFYITLAKNETNNPKQQIFLLKKALNIFPEMYKGVDILLQAVVAVYPSIVTDNSVSEMEHLRLELIKNIQALLEAGEITLANKVIKEYEEICGPDAELILLKSQVLLH